MNDGEAMIGIEHTGKMADGRRKKGGIGFPSWDCDGTPRPAMEERHGLVTLQAGESIAVPADWLPAAMEKGAFGHHFEHGPLTIIPADAVASRPSTAVTVRNTTAEPMLDAPWRIPAHGSVDMARHEVVGLLGSPARQLFVDGTLVLEGEDWRNLYRPGSKRTGSAEVR
ncbi:MAG: hypothetical protein ACOCXM_03245 [Myxococcota bacterium]